MIFKRASDIKQEQSRSLECAYRHNLRGSVSCQDWPLRPVTLELRRSDLEMDGTRSCSSRLADGATREWQMSFREQDVLARAAPEELLTNVMAAYADYPEVSPSDRGITMRDNKLED